jgi:hypothetical protein
VPGKALAFGFRALATDQNLGGSDSASHRAVHGLGYWV